MPRSVGDRTAIDLGVAGPPCPRRRGGERDRGDPRDADVRRTAAAATGADWSELWRPDGNSTPSYDLDWRRFQAARTTEFIAWQAELVPTYAGQLRQVAWALVSRGARMVSYWHWHSIHHGAETFWGGILGHGLEIAGCPEHPSRHVRTSRTSSPPGPRRSGGGR
ncbi:beta-galactosidase [Kribbella sp.]|uniref:beta-galactosidase n=1 Tax=Kribbella sp. TaxID=1871183 RepID=UPI0039C8FB7B